MSLSHFVISHYFYEAKPSERQRRSPDVEKESKGSKYPQHDTNGVEDCCVLKTLWQVHLVMPCITNSYVVRSTMWLQNKTARNSTFHRMAFSRIFKAFKQAKHTLPKNHNSEDTVPWRCFLLAAWRGLVTFTAYIVTCNYESLYVWAWPYTRSIDLRRYIASGSRHDAGCVKIGK